MTGKGDLSGRQPITPRQIGDVQCAGEQAFHEGGFSNESRTGIPIKASAVVHHSAALSAERAVGEGVNPIDEVCVQCTATGAKSF